MSDVAITEQPRITANPFKDRTKSPVKVRGKLFSAIELMVFDGLPLDEAAQSVGLTTYTVRQAFAKPHVLVHLKQRREVLRAAASGKNILRLCEIRDAENNMPAVNAIKVLEQLGDEQQQRGSAVSASPGVTIRIVNVIQSEQAVAQQRVTTAAIEREPASALLDPCPTAPGRENR
jgi:hypothetical protein